MASSLKKFKKKNFLKIEFFLLYFFLPTFIIFINRFILILPTLLIISFALINILKSKNPLILKKLFNEKIHWNLLILLTISFTFFLSLYVYFLDKSLLFSLPKNNFSVWALVVLLYPILSVVPQEIIFRLFFFSRYSIFFNNKKSISIAINALVFSFSHIVFLNFHAIFLTALISPALSYTYLNKSFKTCVLAHTIAGQLVFTFGLGIYFYGGTFNSFLNI